MEWKTWQVWEKKCFEDWSYRNFWILSKEHTDPLEKYMMKMYDRQWNIFIFCFGLVNLSVWWHNKVGDNNSLLSDYTVLPSQNVFVYNIFIR